MVSPVDLFSLYAAATRWAESDGSIVIETRDALTGRVCQGEVDWVAVSELLLASFSLECIKTVF